MFDRAELVRLRGASGVQGVLSVYASGGDRDPAAQGAWFLRLDQEVRAERKRLEEQTPVEVAGFDAAWTRLLGELPSRESFLGAPGWVGFASPERVIHAAALPAAVPAFAGWERSPCLAPLAAARSYSRPFVAVLVDHRHARVFRYEDGALTETHDHTADRSLGDLNEVGVRKRAATHSGMRGQTSHEAAHYGIVEATERLVRELVEPVREAVGAEVVPIFIGGDDHVAHALRQALPAELRDDAQLLGDLYLRMPATELKQRLEAARTSAWAERSQRRVGGWLEDGRSRGRAALGLDDTWRALGEGAVDVLLLSQRFYRERLQEANRLVDLALDQGGDVEMLDGEASERLDQETEGVGAVLRFAVAAVR
ncbi:MAG: hypothetical protein R3E10_06185 [Gemmatimonadota bacterium]